MAAILKVYAHAGVHLAAHDFDWSSGTSDTFKLSLHTSAYAVSQANDEFFSDLAHELAGTGGYTAGGLTLAGIDRGFDATTRETRFLADDVSLAALTPSSPYRYGVVFQDTGVPGTSILVAYVNFGADQDNAGLPFAIQWPVTGVWYAQAA